MRRVLHILAWVGVVLMILAWLLSCGLIYYAHVRGGLDAPAEWGGVE